MKIKFDYRKYLFVRVSTDEKSDWISYNWHYTPLFFIQVNLAVKDGGQFTEACHGVEIWQEPNLKSVPEILHHFVKLFRDTGFLVPFNGFASSKLNNLVAISEMACVNTMKKTDAKKNWIHQGDKGYFHNQPSEKTKILSCSCHDFST